MGWNSKIMRGVKALSGLFLLSAVLLLTGGSAKAQLPGNDCATVPADCFNGLCNAYLCLYVGYGANVSGSLGIISTANSPTDPGGGGFGNLLLSVAPLEPVNPPGLLATYYGSWLFVRVDGGAGGLAGLMAGGTTGTSSSGGDYLFGDERTGVWLQVPTVVGNHIEASWTTEPHAVTGPAGGGFNATYNPMIEIDMVATFVHDTVRFQFDIINNSPGQTHTVGLAFVQDINVQPTITYGTEIDGPLRIPGQPDLHHETLLSGGQVPQRWETFVQITPATNTAPALIHSIRGTLKPSSGSQTEPTTPSRFAYGRTIVLDAFYQLNGARVRNFDQVWNFTPDPNVILDAAVSSKSTDGSVCVYWDAQAVAPGQDLQRVTYVGNADAENSFGAPLALSVTGPAALSFTTDHTTTPATISATPNPFQISAYVQNLTDLSQSGGLAIGPINLFIDLPKGLMLASGDTATKTITNVAPGGEGAVSWSVVPDPTAQVNGLLTYTVTASPNIGNGKSVQKTIEIPAPAALTLLSNAATQGLYKMVSFPLLFGSATPSAILGLPTTGTPEVDVVRFDPVSGHYIPENTFTLGQAYWIRSELSTTQSFTIDASTYPPLANQVQPNATTLKLSYPQGWNQIADPYVYQFKFSELQVFDTDSLTLTDIVSASDTLHQWILPAIYEYDSSDANPANWQYVLEDNFGFEMIPYNGYWMYVKKANLQFIFPGADTPGGQVTRAALVGAGVGSTSAKASLASWKLKLVAKNSMSTDVANIGVAPKASDNEDNYKYGKPPTMGNTVQLSIVHPDWKTTSLMQDMRAPGNTTQTWNLTVTSPKPNQTVTLTWPNVTSSVPRNYGLTLVDASTNAKSSLMSTGSYTINTGTTGTRQIQIIAQPRTVAGSVAITTFNINSTTGTRGAGTTAVTINYALSQDADTQIIIRDGGGRAIRTLTPSRSVTGAATPGTGTAVWDMRDQSGVKITAGTYSIELNALGSTGQRVRQIKPFNIVR